MAGPRSLAADEAPSVLALVPSTGLGGGIESYVDAVLEQVAALGVPLERCAMIDMTRGHRASLAGKAAFCARALAGAFRLRRRREPVVVWAMLPAFALLALGMGVVVGRKHSGIRVFCYGTDAWTLSRLSTWACRRRRVELVTISSFSAGALARVGQAAILPPGIPEARYEALLGCEATEQREGPLRVLSVFRLADAEGKGAFALLEAAERVRRAGGDVEVVLAGIGPPPTALVDEVGCRSGWASLVVSPDERALVGLYGACDLFVLATRFRSSRDAVGEGFGIVLVEAALAGRPVVAPARAGASSALLDGVTGVVPDDESVESLVAALHWAASCRGELEQMGRAGRAWAAARFAPARTRAGVSGLLRPGGFSRPLDVRLIAPPGRSPDRGRTAAPAGGPT